MSLDIHLKQTKLIKKKLTLTDITNTLDGYAYGVGDSAFVLTDFIGDFEDKYLIFYNPNRLGRGFTLQYMKSDRSIHLNLNIPCTYNDIEIFYDCTLRLCKLLNISKFEQDGEILTISNIPSKMYYIKDWSTDIFNKFVNDGKVNYIFGAIYPIHIEESFVEEIKSLDNNDKIQHFEEYLHRKQNQDLYYATASVYQRNNKTLFGCFTLTEGVTSVFPDEPSLPILSQDLDISEWYIGIVSYTDKPCLEGSIPFETLRKILNLSTLSRFDNSHFIITLNQNNIDLLRPHFIEI